MSPLGGPLEMPKSRSCHWVEREYVYAWGRLDEMLLGMVGSVLKKKAFACDLLSLKFCFEMLCGLQIEHICWPEIHPVDYQLKASENPTIWFQVEKLRPELRMSCPSLFLFFLATLGTQASPVVACRLSSWGAQAQLPLSMCDLSSPTRDQNRVPALEGRFLTTTPPGRSRVAQV